LLPFRHQAMRDQAQPGKAPQPKCTVLMLLTNAYEPDPRVSQEARALIAAGFHVRLLAWDRDLKSRPSECIEGVEVRRVHLRSKHGRGATQVFFYARLYLRMLWMGWHVEFDAVHCHDLDTLPLGFVLGAAKRKPVIYDAHESFPDMLAESVPAWLRQALVHLENFLIRRIDLLITVGEKLRRHFEERGARRAVTVGNWKRLEDYARPEEDNLELRRHLGIPDSALLVACITQLLGDRKIGELLDAVDASPNVYALIGGKGALEGFVRERAAANPRILYLGFVKSKEIPVYTCAADVIYYGFDPENPNARYSAPNKLYEAVAAGRPLITGDFGEIADVVREADCGIVLSHYSADSVREALERLRDPERRQTLADNAARYGRTAMNWNRGQAILYREYAALLPRAQAEALCLG
jgi:glycosyltransferase involved in cell wall biosynthesis